jgi:hypothetical protein
VPIVAVPAGTDSNAEARPGALLSEDFALGTLDPAKWWVNGSIPQGRARASVANSAVVLENRVHLNTVTPFDPYEGGLRITGEWTFASDDDFLQILTRSDGTPAGPYGETANGIVFGAYMTWGDRSQRIMISGNGTEAHADSSAPLEMHPGETFLFEIVDAAPSLFFRMTKKGAAERTASVRAGSSYHPKTNLVTFHNREYQETNHVALLRNVVIEHPENRKELADSLGLASSTPSIESRSDPRWASEPLADGPCTFYAGVGCYWMENSTGNYCWIPAGKNQRACFELDSCGGGLGRSGGGCYKWSATSASPGIAWDH